MRLRDDWISEQGGVLPRHRLEAWGNTAHEIRTAVAKGGLEPVRHGWYATPGADADVVRAVAAGGALTCVSVLRRHGVWTLDRRLHVATGRRGLLRPLCDAVVCPAGQRRSTPVVAVCDLDTAIQCAARCCPAEDLLVLLESVVNLQLRSHEQLECLLVTAPRRVQRVLQRMAPSESGTETMVRSRLEARGIKVRSQVQIGDIGRVDLLVGSSLVIEVDSLAHHTSAIAYEKDRERDRRLRALGYTVIRLSYHQVVHRWDEVEPDLLHLIAMRAHRQRVEAA
ncbi:endonuclease domain-containing protein [Luteococcus sp. Sow4_B9]|uniref:endonuclease domain-containing protein n=1 Tax=Luteococcus sp. Sow4_B9 TaxID=3438792 RepID=UPI003F98EEE2